MTVPDDQGPSDDGEGPPDNGEGLPDDGEGQRRSGLKNPARAVRSVGATALASEGLVMLLAIIPLQVIGAHLPGFAVGTVVAIAVVCFGLAGLLRYAWAWWAGSLVPVALVVAGIAFHPSLTALGVLFGLMWAYVLWVRRSVLKD
jgi:hypothetical protein